MIEALQECTTKSDIWTAVQHMTVGGGIALSVISLCIAAVACVFFWALLA